MDKFEEYIKARYPVDYEHLKEKYPNVPVGEFYGDEKVLWSYRQAEVEEKDKRIEELERSCISYKNQRDDYAQKLMVKSVHYISIQEELAKLKDRLELAHHLATQSTWSSLKQLKKVVKALRGENANS